MIKKLFCFLLIILLFVGLTGCASNNESQSKSSSEGIQEASSDQQTKAQESTNNKTEDNSQGNPAQNAKTDTSNQNKTENVAAVGGEKTITVIIEGKDGQSTRTLTTNSENLSGALKQENLIQGATDDPDYIITVDGYTADLSQGEWWQIIQNGLPLSDSVEDTPVNDGDRIELTLQTIQKQTQ